MGWWSGLPPALILDLFCFESRLFLLQDELIARLNQHAGPPLIVDDVEIVIVEMMARIAQSDGARVGERLAGLLRVGGARDIARPAVDQLVALHRPDRLDEATRVQVASALGEVGGAETRAALDTLAASADSGETALLVELELAHRLAGAEV